MSRSPVRVILALVLVLVVVVGAAGGFIWWKLGSLKERLLADLGRSLGAQVQVASIDVDFWQGELHVAGITLTNLRPSQPWEKGDIAQATVRYQLKDIFAPSMPISVEVSSWNVVLHSPLRAAETPPDATSPAEEAAAEPSKPDQIYVTHLSAHEGTVEFDFADDRKATLQGVAFESSDNGAGVWTTQLQASSIKAETMEVGASSVQIRGEADKIAFSDLHMQCGPGAINGDGDMTTASPHDMQLALKGVDVPMSMLVAIDWQTQLAGLVTFDLHYLGNDQGGTAKGAMSVNHGKFNVLPWLGKVTTLVGLPDISDVEVDKATTDFEWKDRALHLTNLDVRKTDVTRIAGTVDVDPQGDVDGKLKLGLPSTVTAKWPQLQTAVFPVQFEDYNWADVHVTGKSDHLQEDLTPRLISAGMGQGSDLLNQGMQKAGSLLNSILGK